MSHVRPGDHPEFFLRPPPPGRSRESTIVLDRHGRFFHDGERVEHGGLNRGLARWVRRHPDNGRYILENGYDWCYFEVEATPFFVTALEATPSGPIMGEPLLVLSDGSREPLDPGSAAIDDDEVLRVRVKGGTEQARFTQAAQLQIAPFVAEDEPLALIVAGKRYEVSQPSGV